MLTRNLTKAFPAFLVAIGGVGFAWLWLHVHPLAALVAVSIVGAIGLVAGLAGVLVARAWPVASIWMLEIAVLLPAAILAGLAGTVTLVGIVNDPLPDAGVEQKKFVAAVTGALSAFLVTGLLKDSDELDAKWIGATVKAVFQNTWKGRFTSGSAAWQAANSDLGGNWGWKSRRKRARTIQKSLHEAAKTKQALP